MQPKGRRAKTEARTVEAHLSDPTGEVFDCAVTCDLQDDDPFPPVLRFPALLRGDFECLPIHLGFEPERRPEDLQRQCAELAARVLDAALHKLKVNNDNTGEAGEERMMQ